MGEDEVEEKVKGENAVVEEVEENEVEKEKEVEVEEKEEEVKRR